MTDIALTKISVSLGRAVNIGNFSNVKADVSAECLIDPEIDDPDAKMVALHEWIGVKLRAIITTEVKRALAGSRGAGQ